ncbi:peptide-methionine (S)-S-oxide reductase MsrA [Eleftheria terrae]|uniref:peptide-methionine (S)-S-oxide reductase MsrA n=1 Tax=Eleftheria terrae TaxID=1597781 RepID=UPI00263A7937|nr:peptide-methionine (S)-S-oxide reductase MsrA [Eleftheria terrae]WKB52429.1 peptide-methionine (S)-S-oxide reductase MsrA [Eleftheria terrae]
MDHNDHSQTSAGSGRRETIYLAGGCFWCLEAVFDRVDGVLDVESGYSNGAVVQPSYEQVCSGETGHAEVVRLEFDPGRISLRELLEIFFVIHDPTTLNRQGNDVGTQYRSGIYVSTPQQQEVARAVMDELAGSGTLPGPLVTELEPVDNYWPAEAYHQNYFENHPGQGYCAFVVAPKVEKFRRTFASRLRRA